MKPQYYNSAICPTDSFPIIIPDVITKHILKISNYGTRYTNYSIHKHCNYDTSELLNQSSRNRVEIELVIGVVAQTCVIFNCR